MPLITFSTPPAPGLPPTAVWLKTFHGTELSAKRYRLRPRLYFSDGTEGGDFETISVIHRHGVAGVEVVGRRPLSPVIKIGTYESIGHALLMLGYTEAITGVTQWQYEAFEVAHSGSNKVRLFAYHGVDFITRAIGYDEEIRIAWHDAKIGDLGIPIPPGPTFLAGDRHEMLDDYGLVLVPNAQPGEGKPTWAPPYKFGDVASALASAVSASVASTQEFAKAVEAMSKTMTGIHVGPLPSPLPSPLLPEKKPKKPKPAKPKIEDPFDDDAPRRLKW